MAAIVGNNSFGRHNRLSGRTNFIRLLTPRYGSKRLKGKFCDLYYMPEEKATPRFGIRVTRTAGNAVSRNRIKRIIRESLRKSKNNWPQSMSIVISVSKPPENEYGLIGEIEDMLRSIK